MTRKHTPGPWHVGDIHSDGHTMVTSADGLVADFIHADDARLIAAAPELYDALAETLDEAIGWFDDATGKNADDDGLEWVKRARKALAKARGEAVS